MTQNIEAWKLYPYELGKKSYHVIKCFQAILDVNIHFVQCRKRLIVLCFLRRVSNIPANLICQVKKEMFQRQLNSFKQYVCPKNKSENCPCLRYINREDYLEFVVKWQGICNRISTSIEVSK